MGVAVDLMGPWDVKAKHLGHMQIHAFTMIDTCTTLSEIKCIDHKTSENIDEVLLIVKNPAKMEPKLVGPHIAEEVHFNGTVTMSRNQHALERINVRRLQPYHRRA